MAADDSERLNALRSLLAAGEENGPADADALTADEEARLQRVKEYLDRQTMRNNGGTIVGKNDEIMNEAKLDVFKARVDRKSNNISSDPEKERPLPPIPPPFINNNKEEEEDDRSSSSTAVFNRLYNSKPRTSLTNSNPEESHKPKIDPRSRQLASSDRGSLYERALQQRFRQETARDVRERQEREDRARSKLSHSSQEMAWNRLKREIEHLFAARISQAAEEEEKELSLDREELVDVSKQLNLQEIAQELFDLMEESGRLSLETFCAFMKRVTFPSASLKEDEDDVAMQRQVKRLLIGRKAVASTASLERVFREVAAETPFSPQITERSRVLDQKRFEKLGIDPTLSRADKIHAEVGTKAEQREHMKMRHAKKELAECTFRPQTTKFTTTTTAVTESGQQARQDVGSRLYKDSIERKNRLLAKTNERVNTSMSAAAAECTFKPQVNKKSPPTGSASLLEVRAFDSSVDRFKQWRLKHVVEEDKRDIKYAQKQHQLPSRPVVQYARQLKNNKTIIFQADVSLPSGRTEQVVVKEGEELDRVAEAFARKHGLGQDAEMALWTSLAEGLGLAAVEEEEQQENEVLIDVLVRPGETYTLRITSQDDPEEIGYAFAEDVQMDEYSTDRLIESLRNLHV